MDRRLAVTIFSPYSSGLFVRLKCFNKQSASGIKMKSRWLALCAALALAACAQNPSHSDQVRICDDQGCSNRSKSQVSFEASGNGNDADTDGRITALKSAAQKEPRAAYDLGLRYFRGDGVRQDSYQALVWMRKAAEGGDLEAQKALGNFYLFGLEEMGSDPREAEKWLLIASGRGDAESRKLLEQARAAKKSEETYYKWQTEWRAVYYGYWSSGYPYYGRWQQRSWYGY
ncbi:TPR protein, SEL1 subfamily [Caballeronia sordidicola]|uniref:TPR protein, SEL1 subfamily n=2 Tax=Caballeronia sordidicola TaxID=196367 RepID=A0A242MHS8_CABSO|nr:TPR protein, SEL1 subfamily [Caballeronia sordidicola]